LGTAEKATDILLSAFAKSAAAHDWTLKLIGPVKETFRPSIDLFCEQYPQLKERVIFLGKITDKETLSKEYRKAKIFTLPSRSESFGIVLVEAANEGCYLITTDMVPAGYDVNGNGRFGLVVPADNADALANAFSDLCGKNNSRDWNKEAQEISLFAQKTFCWDTIIRQLYKAITECP
ncbi:MAG TPA: glycosyltransferase, partial [Lachnospiraceae bacterium]|nr:glycosyltransferase [Lachnospiraceae bacterium]